MVTAMAKVEQLTAQEARHNEVTLVVPSGGDASLLREFTEKVTQIFGARILRTVGCSAETSITVEVDEAVTMPVMLNQLMNMPEVERAEEKEIKNHQARKKCLWVKLANQQACDQELGITQSGVVPALTPKA